MRRSVGIGLVIACWAWAPGAAGATAPTIDSYNLSGSAGTFAECGNVIDQHADTLAPPGSGSITGSGPFSVTHNFVPADASASCAAGSGTDHTSGSLASSGAIDSNAILTLTQSGQGSTTATTNYVGDPPQNDCLDVGLDIGTANTVQFTISQATPFSLKGTTSSTGQQAEGRGSAGYSLTGPGTNLTSQANGAAPNLSGMLQPGTYQYTVGGSASNDFACELTGTETDSFGYSLTLRVGQQAPLAPPQCTLSSPGKVRVVRDGTGRLRVSVRCNQPVVAKLAGTLTDKPQPTKRRPNPRTRHFALPGASATLRAGIPAILKLKLPAAAVRDLQRGAAEKVKLALSATNVNGGQPGHASATVKLHL